MTEEHAHPHDHEHREDATPWIDDIVMPLLLHLGRRPYGAAIRRAMANGFDDMPRRGAFIIGALNRGEVEMRTLPAAMGVSKQAVSQLIDMLVMRGYVERTPDPEDRRTMRLNLTERGRAAAGEVRAAVDGVDAAWAEAVGSDAVRQARRTLGALAQLAPSIGEAAAAEE
jgi:DNA-binding MarR family transcriptional regulator